MVKVISLSDEAYRRLKTLKGVDKSFSEVVIEVTKSRVKKRNLMDFFGIWKNDDEWNRITKTLEEDRKKFKLREVRL